MDSDTPAVVKIDPELVKLNPIAETAFAETAGALIKLGVPLPQIVSVSLVNLLTLCHQTGNRAKWASQLRAAAEILERKEAEDGH